MQLGDWSAVSNLIGIVVMVGVTVGMIALAGSIVFDLDSETKEPARVSIDTTLTESDSSTTVRAKVLQNQNAERIFLRYPTKSSDESEDCGSILRRVLGLPTDCDGSDEGDSTGEKNVANRVGKTGVVSVTADADGSGDTEVKSGSVQVVAVVDGNQQVLETIYY